MSGRRLLVALASLAAVALAGPVGTVSVNASAAHNGGSGGDGAGGDNRVCATAPVAPFVDVHPTNVHAEAVDCLFWYRVAGGVSADTYEPAARVRRDQMATFVAGAVAATGTDLPPPDEEAFSDVDGNVHREAIERLAAADLVEGRGDGRYEPVAAVPRGQMTAFLIRAYEYVTGRDGSTEQDHFRDDDGHTHEATINAAAELDLADGRGDSTFAPDTVTDRQQMASFLSRLLGRFGADGALAARPADYASRKTVLGGALRRQMTGVSWREGCPHGLDELRLVQLVHHGFGGDRRWGQLVVHRHVADDVARALGRVYEAGFVIQRMQLVHRFDADDNRSMAANNTSAFNCRRVAGSSSWSRHAYGTAIDVNPVQNPYVDGDYVAPEAGREYLDRDDVRSGMIVRPGPVIEVFDDLGWGWGGDWNSAKDYQHLSRSGR